MTSQYVLKTLVKLTPCCPVIIRSSAGGHVDGFGNLNPRLRGVGLAAVVGGFIIAIYYCVVLAWSGVYFVNSFNDTSPWAATGAGQWFDQTVLMVSIEYIRVILVTGDSQHSYFESDST